MAKNTQPILKRCKTLGISPAVLGVSKETKRTPKQSRRKQSEYATQLTEKQKVKFIYGVLETPFRRYYEKAEKMEGKTGEMLPQMTNQENGIQCRRRKEYLAFLYLLLDHIGHVGVFVKVVVDLLLDKVSHEFVDADARQWERVAV